MRSILPAAITALALTLSLPACSSAPRGPYAPMTEHDRNPHEAHRLNAEAADLMPKDPQRAETLLREALTHDLYCGPAHNNLGVLYLAQGLTYQAASEFQFARKLMPGHPDPRLNLGIALERAGRIDEALASYDAALEVYPGHIATLQALARAHLRHNLETDATTDALREIALRGESEQWREWARGQLSRQSPAEP